VKQLQTFMPTAAWQLFEGAAKTDIEAACISCLTSMNGFMQADPAGSMQVFGVLDQTQQSQLMTIINAIQNFTMQAAGNDAAQPAAAPPPPASPSNGGQRLFRKPFTGEPAPEGPRTVPTPPGVA